MMERNRNILDLEGEDDEGDIVRKTMVDSDKGRNMMMVT